VFWLKILESPFMELPYAVECNPAQALDATKSSSIEQDSERGTGRPWFWDTIY
jgi:hypothetical protein